MDVLVVIVNYRTPDLTVACLRALQPEVASWEGGVRVVVTDNLSPDDSVKKIGDAIAANGWSDWCELMPLPANGGFAYGNNAAIRPALTLPPDQRPRYIYLLNPDTIPFPGAVRELATFLDAHPHVGIAGGRAENEDGSVRRTAFRFDSPLGQFESALRLGVVSRALSGYIVAPEVPDRPAPFGWVSGASMMVRREVFEQVGLLDEGYFMYYEETDFCLRAARAGWPTWYVPASRIIHLVGQASGVTGAKRAAKRRPRYWFDSRHRYFRKNLGVPKALLSDVLWASGAAMNRVIDTLRRRQREDPPWLLWDFLRYNARLWLGGGPKEGAR